MRNYGTLQLIQGKQSELNTLNQANSLFYAEDTGNYYLYNGTDKIKLTQEVNFETEGFTGTFDTDTDTITVSKGLITGVQEIPA